MLAGTNSGLSYSLSILEQISLARTPPFSKGCSGINATDECSTLKPVVMESNRSARVPRHLSLSVFVMPRSPCFAALSLSKALKIKFDLLGGLLPSNEHGSFFNEHQSRVPTQLIRLHFMH